MTIVVVGAGPAGLAAASSAGDSGAEVTLIDDNSTPGGQIWRGSKDIPFRPPSRICLIPGARVVSAGPPELTVETSGGSSLIPYDKLILATGARELFLPFPGWTLPGVMGAGGLQALAKSGLPVAGKRIVIAGTGPLLLAVAAYLAKRGAKVLSIAEQAPWASLIRFGAGLPLSKWLQAAALWSFAFSPGTWVESAAGDSHLGQVTLRQGSGTWTLDCDYLATGYGLVPNTELAELLGCDPARVDEFQAASLPNVYCAGEITGIGGVELSIVEGRIAGFAAAGRDDEARRHFASRARWQRFARGMTEAFALRPELKSLARPDTFVCRCEDVPYSSMAAYTSWREAKLQTRCGMGPCQGRVCGPAAEFLFGWRAEPVRPPVFPTRVGTLITESLLNNAKETS
jgi:NADPH-dependent 2,4-dienoyl-CoA reductase/sulfur reductase-like enzyme